MALLSSKRADIILARSKRTNEKYPARTSHLSGSHPNSEDLVPLLHFTDNTRSKTCRCRNAKRHSRAHPVSGEDKHLAIAVTRYMDKLGLESCLQSVFHQYSGQQRMEWALSDVRAERFHYSRKNKDVVCRCNIPQHHDLRQVHSPEIQELCAEFFQLNKAEIECSREQWRKVDLYSQRMFAKQSILKANQVEPGTSLPLLRKSTFAYDSPSVVDLVDRREKCPQSSHERRPRRSSSPRTRHTTKSPHMARLSSGPTGGADIPEHVWRVSRPSIYLGQYETESNMSTPLGSSATPAWHNAGPVRKTREFRPSRLDILLDTHSNPRHRHTYRPSLLGVGSGNVHSNPRYRSVPSQPEADISELEVSPHEVLRHSTLHPSQPSVVNNNPNASTVELPCPAKAAELDTTSVHSRFLPHHSATLQELEGNSSKHVAELSGKRLKRYAPKKGHL